MLLLSVQRSAILKRTPKGSIRLSRTGYPGQVARPVHQRAVYRKMPQNKVPKAFEKSAKKPAKELAPGQTTLSPKRDVAAHAMIDVATDGTTSSTAPLSAMKKPTGTRTSSPFKISAEVLHQLEVAVAKMSPSQPKRRLRSAIHLMEIRELRPPMQSPSPLYPSTCTHPSHVTCPPSTDADSRMRVRRSRHEERRHGGHQVRRRHLRGCRRHVGASWR